MEQLRYPEELRSFADVPIDEAEVKNEELKLALQLVEQAASEHFQPENYRDEVRDRTIELIERKINGEDITVSPTEEPETKIIDIMDALKASIAAGEKDSTAKRKPAKRAAKKKTETKKATKAKRS